MRKETKNDNFDRPCFVQTVCIFVRFSLKLPARGEISLHTVLGSSVRVWWVDVYTDTRHAETLQIDDERETWWNWQNFSDSLCGELLVGLLLGVAKDGREHFLCGKAAWSQQWLQPSVVNAKWDRQKKGFKIYVWLPWETRLRYAIRLCCFIVEVRNCRRTDFPNFWWTVCKAVLMTFGPPSMYLLYYQFLNPKCTSPHLSVFQCEHCVTKRRSARWVKLNGAVSRSHTFTARARTVNWLNSRGQFTTHWHKIAD